MKILWNGVVFAPTGIATASREMVKELVKQGHKVQVTHPWTSKFDCNEGLQDLNNSIDVNDEDITTVFFDYPHNWKEAHGQVLGGAVHEGTKLPENWAAYMNQADKIWVPSKATKNLFKWNGVKRPIYVIPHGVNELYKPDEDKLNLALNKSETDPYTFLSINSWTGHPLDRKAVDILVKAFDEEFGNDTSVKLILKFGTFFAPKFDIKKKIEEVLGHTNENIYFNDDYKSEKELVSYMNNADSFVSATRGEGFGMGILNAMACGLPVIVTKDRNSGHMDFCKGKDSVLFVDAPEVIPGDPSYYSKGNLLANPDIESLKKQMRYAYENRNELRKKAVDNSKDIRENWTWKNSVDKLLEAIKDESS